MLPIEVLTRTLSAFEVMAAGDLRVLELEVLPALHLDGWWTGNLDAHHQRRATRSRPAPRSGCTRRPTAARRGSPGSPATSAPRRPCTSGCTRRSSRTSSPGLPHRSIFLDRLDLSLRRTQGDAAPVALLFVSLDRFKEKNDRFGREVGDQLLRLVAERLDALRGPTDTVSRWGGDEFVFMCEAKVGELDAEALAASHPRGVRGARSSAGGTEVFLTASVGVSTAPPGEVGTDQLLRQADAAGQMAKHRGGGAVHLFDEEMQARALRRAEVEDALRGAADRSELVLHFQPEVSLRTNQIVAVEALVRWQHPDWGLVAPGEFVPVAETLEPHPRARHLGARRRRWSSAPAGAPTFGDRTRRRWPSTSRPASSSRTTSWSWWPARSSAPAPTPPTSASRSPRASSWTTSSSPSPRCAASRALGVQLAVDDFGTGYSSLSYLRRFPVDILKVDQSFVSGLGHDPEDSAIVQAVVHMGRALQLTTVAEGVETAHHLIELRELDCDIAQGYHFARPRPAEAISRMLEAGPDWMRVNA